MRARLDPLVFLLTALGATLVARVIAPALTFNLWDNFETLTPNALAAHGAWLAGDVPILNLRQSLGAPTMGVGDHGVLYLPYTIALWLARRFATDQALPEIAGSFHFALATAGWYALARAAKARDGLATLFAAGLAGSGYFTLGSAIWAFIGVTYAWLPWIWLGLAGVIERRSTRAFALFAIAWAMCAYGAHVQQLAYAGVHTGLLALVLAWPRRRDPRAWAVLVALAAVMVALVAPTVVYTIAVRAMTERAHAVSAADFFAYALTPAAAWALITPAAAIGEGYLGCTLSWLLFAGAWVPLGLTLLPRARDRARAFGLLAIAALFLDFACGGFVYSLTRVVPLWSSFRFVFKFAPHVTIGFALAALVGLRDAWDRLPRRVRVALALGGGVTPFFGAGGPSALTWFAAAHAALVVSTLAVRAPVLVTRAAAAAYLTCALWVASELSIHRHAEKYHAYGAAYFGLDAPESSRLASVGRLACDATGCPVQTLGYLDSASVNDYFSVSGHQMGMTAVAIRSNVSDNETGLVPPSIAAWAIGSPLYRRLAVRYYLFGDHDVDDYRPLLARRGLDVRTRRDGWWLFEDPRAGAPVSVAEVAVDDVSAEAHPSTRDPSATEITRAIGLPATIRSRDTRVDRIAWRTGRGLGFDALNESAEDAFAVASIFPWAFVDAFVDGRPVPKYPSNALFTGVVVPPGRHHVEIRARATPLTWAAAIALAVTLIAAAVVRACARPRKPISV